MESACNSIRFCLMFNDPLFVTTCFSTTDKNMLKHVRLPKGSISRPLKNAPFCPIPASGSNFNPQNTLCIPVVKIFAFLGLEQN